MHSLNGVSSDIQVLLRPNDVHILAIVNYLAQERHILQAEDCQVLVLDVISKSVLALQIETTLSKD